VSRSTTRISSLLDTDFNLSTGDIRVLRIDGILYETIEKVTDRLGHILHDHEVREILMSAQRSLSFINHRDRSDTLWHALIADQYPIT
jgi:hypothetical protein